MNSQRRLAASGRLGLGFLGVMVVLAGCGGSAHSGSGATAGASLSVAVAGLNTGASFVLQDATGDKSTISQAGTVSFPTQLASGASYTLSIASQPAGQFCNIANGSGTVGSASDGAISIGCAQVLAGGSGAVATSGGTVTTAAADVTIPAGAAIASENITVSTVAAPAGLPSNVVPIGAAVDINLDQPAMLNAPLVVNIRYDASIVPNETNLAVLHYNTTTSKWEPVRIIAQDTTAHQLTIVSRTFSPHQVIYYDPSITLPASHMVTNFTPQVNGWNINNFGGNVNDSMDGSYFTPSGNCLGMAAYAVWYFANGSGGLNGKFSATSASAGTPSVAQVLAIRAHLAQSQYWSRSDTVYLNRLGEVQTGQLMKFYLAEFDQPLVLQLNGIEVPGGHAVSDPTNGKIRHASVLYGYDTVHFFFYDVNQMNLTQTVPFNSMGFGAYTVTTVSTGNQLYYNNFTYDTVPSLGRTEDFAELTNEAESGFTSSQYITLSSPDSSKTYTDFPIGLTGNLSTALDSRTSLIAYIPGAATPQSIASTPGPFNANIVPPIGTSTILLLAGIQVGINDSDSFWYPNSAAYFFDVSLQTTMQMNPASVTMNAGATQTFTGLLGAKAPTDGVHYFQWTLNGPGSIGAGNTVQTSVNTITYTAPAVAGNATLSVAYMDANGKVLANANNPATTITVNSPTIGISPATVTMDVQQGQVTNQVFTATYPGAGTGTYSYYWLLYGQPAGLSGSGSSTSGQYYNNGSYLWVCSPTPQVTFGAQNGTIYGTFPLTVAVYSTSDCSGTAIATSPAAEITVNPYTIVLP